MDDETKWTLLALGRRGPGGLTIEERHAVAREDLLAPMLLELHAASC